LPSLHTTAARAALLLGLLAWLGGSVAQMAHHVLVAHVVCAEHGEVVEADAHSTRAHVAAPELRSADADTPEHGCDFELATFTATVPTFTGVAVAADRVADSRPLTRARAPRVRPLAYAPKTSPPLS